MIKSVPEVVRVFGKAGRAETATDPAPLEMFETVIQFKPKEQWRPGMTGARLIEELDRVVQVPGLANVWVPPIRNRIDMLATGIKSPVGIKVAGPDLVEIDRTAGEIERAVRTVPGVSSAIAERLTGGRYIDVDIDRTVAARYGLSVEDLLEVVAAAIGGENVGETIEGLQRFPINVRYPARAARLGRKLRALPIVTGRGAQIRLGDVARVSVADGPPMIRSENARPSGWVYVDIRGRDLSSAVQAMQEAVAREVKLPPGYSIAWSGQFEYLERATARLKLVVPAMLLIIFVMLYLTFRRTDEALLVMAMLPFSVIGGVWLLWWLDHNVSVASAVGFIGLAGVVAEFGIVMLVYLKQAWDERVARGETSESALLEAIRDGAALRVRPKAMTVATTVIGLVPILWDTGTGSEITQRIAAPMIGGMITAPLLSMLVIPACYLLMRRGALRRAARAGAGTIRGPAAGAATGAAANARLRANRGGRVRATAAPVRPARAPRRASRAITCVAAGREADVLVGVVRVGLEDRARPGAVEHDRYAGRRVMARVGVERHAGGLDPAHLRAGVTIAAR